MQNTEQLVKEALVSTLDFSELTKIENDASLRNDLRLDSMSSLMFLMKLEESIDGFYVDPDTLQTNDLETVSSVIKYVDMQLLSKHDYVH